MPNIRGYAIQEETGQIRSIRIFLIFLGVASRERNRTLRFFQAAEPAYPFTAALSGKTPLNAYSSNNQSHRNDYRNQQRGELSCEK